MIDGFKKETNRYALNESHPRCSFFAPSGQVKQGFVQVIVAKAIGMRKNRRGRMSERLCFFALVQIRNGCLSALTDAVLVVEGASFGVFAKRRMDGNAFSFTAVGVSHKAVTTIESGSVKAFALYFRKYAVVIVLLT